MLYGKAQNTVWSLVLVLGAATGAAFIVRDVLALGTYAGVAAWISVLAIGGRAVCGAWRRDWVPENSPASPGEDR